MHTHVFTFAEGSHARQIRLRVKFTETKSLVRSSCAPITGKMSLLINDAVKVYRCLHAKSGEFDCKPQGTSSVTLFLIVKKEWNFG